MSAPPGAAFPAPPCQIPTETAGRFLFRRCSRLSEQPRSNGLKTDLKQTDMDNFYESVSVTIRNTPFFKAQKKQLN
jgi:hypothetical protein